MFGRRDESGAGHHVEASNAATRRALVAGMKIVFVVCPSYHGATLLSLLLNNHPEILALGDTIPTRKYDQVCACQQAVSACDFWQSAFRAARAERFESEPGFLPAIPRLAASERANAAANLVLALASRLEPLRRRSIRLAPVAAYLDAYEAFRKTTLDLAGARIFVDGQKHWLTPIVCAALTSHEVSVLHLTRDPRGFAYSMVRRDRTNGVEAARNWRNSHRLIGLAGLLLGRHRYRRIRYEDLAATPHAVMSEIFAFIGVEDRDVVRTPDDSAKRHTMGNRMLKEFDGRVQLDTRWQETFSAEELDGIERAAAPLMKRFGYA